VDWKDLLKGPSPSAQGEARRPKRSPISVGEALSFRVVKKKKPFSANELEKTGKGIASRNSIPPPALRRPHPTSSNIMINPATGEAIQKQGKVKSNTRPKKPSKLKMAILEEREDQHLMAPESLSTYALPLIGPLNPQIGNQDETSDDFVKSHEFPPKLTKVGNRTVELKTDRDRRVAQLKATPKQEVHLTKIGANGWRTTSNIFPLLFHNLITPQLNEQVENMLKKLSIYHYRAKALKDKKPSKAKRGLRFVAGFSQCLRTVVLKRCKLLLVAPNLDEGEGEGGLDGVTMRLVKFAKMSKIPFLFVLNRRKLAKCIGINVRVSVIAIVNVDGCNEEYDRLKHLDGDLQLLSAIKYKKEVEDAVELYRKGPLEATKAAKAEYGHQTSRNGNDREENLNSANIHKQPSIDRFALVDSDCPNRKIAYLGQRNGSECDNSDQNNFSSNHHIAVFNWSQWLEPSSSHDHATKNSELEQQSTQQPQSTVMGDNREEISSNSTPKRNHPPLPRNLSLRCLTTPSHIGSVVWSIKAFGQLTKFKDGNSSTDVSSAPPTATFNITDSPEIIPSLISHHAPFILRVRKGKYVRDWHPDPPNHQSQLRSSGNSDPSSTESNIKRYWIEAKMYREFEGRGEILSSASLDLSIQLPSTDPYSHFFGSSTTTDDAATTSTDETDEEEESKFQQLVDSINLDTSSSDEEDDDEQDEIILVAKDQSSSNQEENQKSTSPKPSLPSTMTPTLDIPPLEQVLLEEEERRKEKKRRKKELERQKNELEALSASLLEAQNLANRQKHSKPPPASRPLLLPSIPNEASSYSHSGGKSNPPTVPDLMNDLPPFTPFFLLPLSKLIAISASSTSQDWTIFLQLLPPRSSPNPRSNTVYSSPPSHLYPNLSISTTHIVKISPQAQILNLIKSAAAACQVKPKNISLYFSSILVSKLVVDSRTSASSSQDPSAKEETEWVHLPLTSICQLSNFSTITVSTSR
jgi:ribosomal protein L7Ae-like RNA K-turn-binding protein